jgi:hypothetical protein
MLGRVHLLQWLRLSGGRQVVQPVALVYGCFQVFIEIEEVKLTTDALSKRTLLLLLVEWRLNQRINGISIRNVTFEVISVSWIQRKQVVEWSDLRACIVCHVLVEVLVLVEHAWNLIGRLQVFRMSVLISSNDYVIF